MKTALTFLAVGVFVLTGAAHSDAAKRHKVRHDARPTQVKIVKATRKQAKAVAAKKVKCIVCPDKSCPECPPCQDCP